MQSDRSSLRFNVEHYFDINPEPTTHKATIIQSSEQMKAQTIEFSKSRFELWFRSLRCRDNVKIQSYQLNMAVCFWYPLKSYLSTIQCTLEKSLFTRPCLSGRVLCKTTWNQKLLRSDCIKLSQGVCTIGVHRFLWWLYLLYTKAY